MNARTSVMRLLMIPKGETMLDEYQFNSLSIGDPIDSPYFGDGTITSTYYQDDMTKVDASFYLSPDGHVEKFAIAGMTYLEYLGFDLEPMWKGESYFELFPERLHA